MIEVSIIIATVIVKNFDLFEIKILVTILSVMIY